MRDVPVRSFLIAALQVLVILPHVTALRPSLEVTVFQNSSSLIIQVNDEQVDKVAVSRMAGEGGKAVEWGGVHVSVLHPASGALLASRFVPTANPAEARVLSAFLESLQPGRILVLVILGHGGLYLHPAEDTLRKLGFVAVVEAVGVGEAWVGVTNGRAAREVVVVVPASPASPISYELLTRPRRGRTVALTVVFLAKPGAWCPWHRRPEMRAQRDFCNIHEGFHELCRCQDPVTPTLARAASPRVPLKESIPVVMSTSRHPYHLYRTLLQLIQMPGGGQTSFLVALEGDSAATIDLTTLFGVPCSQIHPRRRSRHHQDKGNSNPSDKNSNKNSNNNINKNNNNENDKEREVEEEDKPHQQQQQQQQHHDHHLQATTQVIADVTRHALTFAFSTFPAAKKVIFLEDDVLLSPDFLWFFQQTATLLDQDPSVLAVSAHHTFSVAGQGLDPTRLLRGAMPPQWGWMADRRILEAWVPENWGDWDYWVLALCRSRGLDVVFPEVSRSLHAGSGGTHIDGFHQAISFDRQAALLPSSPVRRSRRGTSYASTPASRFDLYTSFSSLGSGAPLFLEGSLPSVHRSSSKPTKSSSRSPHLVLSARSFPQTYHNKFDVTTPKRRINSSYTPFATTTTTTTTTATTITTTTTRSVAPPVLINLTDVSGVVRQAFSRKLKVALHAATPITMHTLHRCGPALIPPGMEGPFVMFFGDPRERSALTQCLGLYAVDPRCDFEHVQQVLVAGHRVFLVDCPDSPHCVHRPPGYLAVPHDDQLMEAVAALDFFRRSLELRTPFRVRRAPNGPWEEATLRNLATGYTALGIHLASLFLNKGVVLPQVEEEGKNLRKEEEESDNLTELQNLSEEGLEWEQRERSPSHYSHRREREAPYTGSESSQQQQQELEVGVGAGAGVRVGQRWAATPSLLKPESGRRVRVKERGKTTALAMSDEGWGGGVRYYCSCLVAPCHVIDPLLHPLLLPPHLQAAARIALREASAPQPHEDSKFTAPDFFKYTDLFIDFYKY